MYAAAMYLSARLRLRGVMRATFVGLAVVGALLAIAKCEGSGPHP